MYNDYENMGIYDLRNYARSLGVSSPTTKKRSELIASINEIINGKLPAYKLTNKGRPPKHKASDENILDVVLPNNLFFNTNDNNYSSIVSGLQFRYGNVLSESGKSSETNILFTGFYKQYSDDFGLAYFKGYKTDYFKENTIILSSMAKEFGIKDGDYIKGECKIITEKNVMLATKIIEINDTLVNDGFKRDIFDNLMPCYPDKKIELKGTSDLEIINKNYTIYRGSRTILNFSSEKQKVENIESFLNCLSGQNNLRTLLISIDDAPEDIGQLMFKCKDVEICSLTLSQTREQFFEKVSNYIVNCVNRLEFNQDVAVVFYNTNKYIKAYCDNLITTQNISEASAKIMAQNKVKDIFNLSRNFIDSSLTIVLFDAPLLLNDNASEVLYFDVNNSQNTDIHVNFETSFSKYLNNVQLQKNLPKEKKL